MVSQTFAALRWTIATTRHSSMNGLAIGEHRPRNWTGLQEISECRFRCCSSMSRKRKLLRIHYPGDPAKPHKRAPRVGGRVRRTIVDRFTEACYGDPKASSILFRLEIETLSALEPSGTTAPWTILKSEV